MTRSFTLGLGYYCTAAVGKLTLMPPSRTPGGVLPKGGSWLIYMLPLNGRTDICSHRLSITSGESQKMTPRLAALVKRVAELHDTGLRTCHCVKEFTLWWIHPLGHRDMMAYECLWLNDLSCDPAARNIFKSLYCC
jgi:hypothetical protein